MSKHTPGPWAVVGGGTIKSGDLSIGEAYIYDENDYDYNPKSNDVRKKLPWMANARLIAAAPEMYELMPKLISLLGNWAYILDQVGAYDTSESWDLADKWIDIRLKIEGDEN